MSCDPSRTRRHRLLTGLGVMLLLAPLLTGCGSSGTKESAKVSPATAECRAHWAEIGQSILGLETDPNPSALPTRWNTIVATVDYYTNSAAAARCDELIEQQQTAIADLRQFSDELRRFDMTYQLDALRAGADVYLHDESKPKAGKGQGDGKPAPPSKKQVEAALATLTTYADQANADLDPAWQQATTVDLDDAEGRKQTIKDLQELADVSDPWLACEAAVKVLQSARDADR